jgi:hypothetical protein
LHCFQKWNSQVTLSPTLTVSTPATGAHDTLDFCRSHWDLLSLC